MKNTFKNFFNSTGALFKVRELLILLLNHVVVRFVISNLVILLLDAFGVLIFTLFSFPLYAQVVLNEFMIDPENDNTGEFIEIFNISDSMIDMRNYFICDGQDTDNVIAFPDSFLHAHSYGLILDPDYTGDYDHLIPDSISLFTFEDARFGQYGISNSTSKCFSLLGPSREVCDFYTTGVPLWPAPGFSIERESAFDVVWNSSLNAGGTPGMKNSTSLQDLDISISDLSCSTLDNILFVNFKVMNTGLLQISEFRYGYIVDIPGLQNSNLEISFSERAYQLLPGDSLYIQNESYLKSRGSIHVVAWVNFGDICDSVDVMFFIPLDQDDIIPTEFVCKTGDSFSAEYIEILSSCKLPIQLMGLEIHDATGSTTIDSNYILWPDSLIVLAQSAYFHDDFPNTTNYIIPPAWRSLNNSGDIICLRDPSGSTICKLQYDAVWNIPADCAMLLVDTALDYRNALNWESSLVGSPGDFNITERQLCHLSCYWDKDFFVPEDTLIFMIVNDGYFPVDESELLFKTPITEQFVYIPYSEAGDTTLCEIDTIDIFTEGTNECTLSQTKKSGALTENYNIKFYSPYSDSPLLFNEALFDPIDTYGQSEFIELASRGKQVDLDHWSLRVNNSTVTLDGNTSEMYHVLDDHSISLPSLPNAGAELFLIDPTGKVLDFCDLRDHDEIYSGKSIEKQSLSAPSYDASVWHASVSSTGMTPGRHNSVTAHPGSRYDLDVYPEVFSPGKDDHLQFSIDSEQTICYCELMCYDVSGACIYHTEINVFNEAACLHFWNGKLSNGTYPARGLYMAVAILHDQNGQLVTLRETFAIR